VRRHAITPRPDWRAKVEALGLVFHTTPAADGAGAAPVPYWNESAYYELTVDDVDRIERATDELHARCLDAVQHVIDRKLYARLGIPPHAVRAIERSWEAGPPSLYGRFDLAYDGTAPPVMLEYNADTPTSLYEAAVVQWAWLEERFPGRDQFNSLHDRLIATWATLRPAFNGFNASGGGPVVHFAHVEDTEDLVTVTYLRDTASQAGLTTVGLHVGDIGFDHQQREFVDLEDRAIRNLFKLYPWEWAAAEEFGPMLLDPDAPLHVIEPAWKMVLSNKGILAVLWELFEDHPNLVPATLDGPTEEMATWGYVRKPLLSREGANVTIVDGLGRGRVETGGDYGAEGYVYQAQAPIPACDAGDGTVRRPVIGSWIIGQEAGGMGIRETAGHVTDNRSQFVPHVIDTWYDPQQYDVLAPDRSADGA